jgi:uncharacterized protein YggT (Ycf19 family)
MLDQSRRSRSQLTMRSQLATELLLNSFAVVGSVILLRTVLIVLSITDRVWIGQFVFGLTDPVTDVLEFLPGASRELVWNLTIIDVTLLGGVVLFLLGIVAAGRD